MKNSDRSHGLFLLLEIDNTHGAVMAPAHISASSTSISVHRVHLNERWNPKSLLCVWECAKKILLSAQMVRVAQKERSKGMSCERSVLERSVLTEPAAVRCYAACGYSVRALNSWFQFTSLRTGSRPWTLASCRCAELNRTEFWQKFWFPEASHTRAPFSWTPQCDNICTL